MSLTKCQECGNEVSTKAKTCPKCGAKVKKPSGFGRKLLLGFVGLVVIVAIIKPITETPEQAAARQADLDKQVARMASARKVADAIKSALKNPSSAQWHRVLVNDTGNVVCVDYSAQNGFGGMNRNTIAAVDGRISEKANVWNKHCANSSLYDETSAVN